MLPLLLAEMTFPPAEVDAPSVIVWRFILVSVTGEGVRQSGNY